MATCAAAKGRFTAVLVPCLIASLLVEVDSIFVTQKPISALAIDVTAGVEISPAHAEAVGATTAKVRVTDPELQQQARKRPLPPSLRRDSHYLDITKIKHLAEAGSDCGRHSKPCASWRSTWQSLLIFAVFLSIWWWLTVTREEPTWHLEVRLALEDAGGAALQRPIRICTTSWELGGSRVGASLEGADRLLAECFRAAPGVGGASSDQAPEPAGADVYAVCLRDCGKLLFREAEPLIQLTLGSRYRMVIHEAADPSIGLGILVFVADTVHAQQLQGPAADARTLGFVCVDPDRHRKGGSGRSLTQDVLRRLKPGAESLSLLAVLGARQAEGEPDAEPGGGLQTGGGELHFRAGPGALARLVDHRICGVEGGQAWDGQHLPITSLLEVNRQGGGLG